MEKKIHIKMEKIISHGSLIIVIRAIAFTLLLCGVMFLNYYFTPP